MMMCSRCHKRPAVVFISPTVNAQETKGLCLSAPKNWVSTGERSDGKMGITEEQMEAMESEFGSLMNPENNGENNEEASRPAVQRPSHFCRIFFRI